MKPLKTILFSVALSLGFSCSHKETVIPTDSQIIGSWKLTQITYGFSQIRKTATEAGIAETLTYKSDGMYQRTTIGQTGQQDEKGLFYTGTNPTKTADKQAIFYPDDKTTQPYSFQDGHLFLYQRGSQDATIADGSTYEYQRQ